MNLFAILIVASGLSGKYGVLSITRFDSMAQCEAARTVFLSEVNPSSESWLPNYVRPEDVVCRPVVSE